MTKQNLHREDRKTIKITINPAFGQKFVVPKNPEIKEVEVALKKYFSEVCFDSTYNFHILKKDDKKEKAQSYKNVFCFDFVIKTKKKTYLIETNYYNSGGSKLNETARAYSDVAPKINQYNGYEFVWITDGQGWLSAKNKLEEAYNIIPSLYNLITLEDFIKKIQDETLIAF